MIDRDQLRAVALAADARQRAKEAAAPGHLDRAARIMAEATSYFIQSHYGREGLDALIEAGWAIIPPADDLDPADAEPEP